MTRQRIQVYADGDMKRRIELAAAKYNVPVTEYCLAAIRQQLVDDDVFEQNNVQISVKPTISNELVDALRNLQMQILARRDGNMFDVDDTLAQIREERTDELYSLR